MASVVIMPRQGQSVESCILTEWYKEVGDRVDIGDPLFAYETDKAAFEEEAKEEGFLLGRFYEAGDEVPVLQNVAVIGAEGETADVFRPDDHPVQAEKKEDVADAQLPDSKPDHKPDQKAAVPPPAEPAGSQEGAISPRARRLAREKHVVAESLRGTGPGGRIIERDVLGAIEQGRRLTPLAHKKLESEGLTFSGEGKTPFGKIFSDDLLKKEGHTDEPLSNVRRIIAEGMYRSLQHSAQLTHHLSAGASAMLGLRKEIKRRMEEGYAYNITLNDMVCYAAVRALKKHPGANAHFLGDVIRKFEPVNLGLAVDTERGLMVPTLLNAHRLSLPELSVQLRVLAEQARGGKISPDLLAPESATFTISNLGNYGVEMFTPVLNLPQVAILGVNTIVHRPAFLPDGSMGLLPFIGLSLTYDHRAIDGGPATLFLAEIKNEIEQLSGGLL